MRTLWLRLVGFAGLPVISMITPLLVLPVFARLAGPDGWASVAAGESVGTLAAIAIAYGWVNAGPARIAATPDPVARALLYRESLFVRGAVYVVALPVVVAVCLGVAAPGFALPTVLMGLAGAVTGTSFAWYAVGVGTPRPIALLEAVPRVAAAAVATALILLTGRLEWYPALAVTVPLVGVVVFSRQVLRGVPLPPVRLRELPALLHRDRGLAAIDVAAGAYGSVPLPVVSTFSPAAAASAYASGDKLYKFALYVPITLGNAFQSWTVEGPVAGRVRRLRVALAAHAVLGLGGLAVMLLLGPWVSGLLFGEDVAVGRAVAAWLGVTFALVSVRISLTRHVLLPAGAVRVILVSTVIGAVVGVPIVVLGVLWLGPVGAAVALAASEVVATGILVGPALRRMATLARPVETHAPDGPEARP